MGLHIIKFDSHSAWSLHGTKSKWQIDRW